MVCFQWTSSIEEQCTVLGPSFAPIGSVFLDAPEHASESTESARMLSDIQTS